MTTFKEIKELATKIMFRETQRTIEGSLDWIKLTYSFYLHKFLLHEEVLNIYYALPLIAII
jgi:hypothetical protein